MQSAVRALLWFSLGVAFLLAEDAAAILLAIHALCAGLLLPHLPAFAVILVMKGYAEFLGNLPGQFTDQFVLLHPAVEQCGGEGVEPTLLGQPGGCLQALGIAVKASLLLAKCNLPEELFEVVVGTNDELQSFPLGKGLDGGQPLFELLIGLNMRVVKEGVYLPARLPKGGKRVDGAGCAAGVKQDGGQWCAFLSILFEDENLATVSLYRNK